MTDLRSKLRTRTPMVGFWLMSDNPVAAERLAGLGYDYLALDAQHGLIDYRGCLAALTAIDAAADVAAASGVPRTAGVVRVQANDPVWIGQALDAGAAAVIVPMINSAAEAAAAVDSCRYAPSGRRSYGPMRSGLRLGMQPDADEAVACVIMVETRGAVAEIEQICATPGLDGVYVGPSDLALAYGSADAGYGANPPGFAEALERVRRTAAAAGIACGTHCPDGATAAAELAAGFTFVSVSSDLSHLESAAKAALRAARTTG